ncbi:MAG TPA: diacylglycerol kinase family protein [Polyangiaceae bacterium]|nr:diacylglycerol kinase family protein [Polyangiaceae bacterium]
MSPAGWGQGGPASSTVRRGAESVWLVVNPASGRNQAADHVESLGARLRDACGPVRVVPTAGPGDAARAAREATAVGARTLFVAGGDGTVNEVVNGLCAAAPSPASRPELGIIPLGTGNDFARSIGIEGEPVEALDGLLEAESHEVDLGVVNGRVFLNVSAGGLAGETSEAVTPELKTFAGRFAYVLGGVRAYIEHESIDVRYRSSTGGKTLRGRERISMFAVCNAPTFGGGRVIAPGAKADDGLLEVCLVREAPAFEFAALLAKLAEGKHVDDPHVLWLRAKRLELFFDRMTKINADGELFEARAASYAVLPRALRVLAPRSARAPLAFEALAKSA